MREARSALPSGGAKYRDVLISNGPSNSAHAEAYRMLRTSISMTLEDSADGNQLGIIVVTSAGSGEGKTSTSANLALVFQQAGLSVALVDADLRLPSQHLVFGVESKSSLEDAMDTAVEAPDSLSEQAVSLMDGLDLYLVGDYKPQYPAEALSATRFRTFLRALRDRYDVVIVDTAPIGLVTDAAVVAQVADGVLLVVSAQQVSRRVVKRAYNELVKAKVPVLGTVMNRVGAESAGGQYGSSYYTTGVS